MGKTILLVDESRTVQQAAQWILEGSADTLVVASSGDEALMLAARHRPEVAVIAYFLADQRGEELTKAFRADPALQSIRVVQLYGIYHPFSAGDARAAGAVGLLQKPFTSEEFLEAIAHAHESEQVTAAATTQPVRQSEPIDDDRLRAAAAALALEPQDEPVQPAAAREETPTLSVPATDPPAPSAGGAGFRRAFSTMAMRNPIRKPSETEEAPPERSLTETAEVPSLPSFGEPAQPAPEPAADATESFRQESSTGSQPAVQPASPPRVEPVHMATSEPPETPGTAPDSEGPDTSSLGDAALDARIRSALETMIEDRLDDNIQAAMAPIVRRELPPLVKSLLKEMLSQLLREQLSRKVEEYSTRRIDAFVAEELPTIAEHAIQKFVQGGVQ